MKHAAGIGLIILLSAAAVFLLYEEEGVDQTYLLPEGYEGCVVIRYDIPDAPKLKIENNEIVYRVPEDGIIETSSPYDYGWVNDEHSGAFQLKAFYIDKEGKRTAQLPEEEIGFGANGASQKDEGEQEEEYYYQYFGPETGGNQACPQMGG